MRFSNQRERNRTIMPQQPTKTAIPAKIVIAPNCSTKPTAKPLMKFAIVDDKYQTPIKSDAMRTGASFVTSESPIGESINSPIVCIKYVPSNQRRLAFTVISCTSPPRCITAPIINKKPTASAIIPSPILIGDDGFLPLFESFTQSCAKIGPRIMINIGFVA